MVEHIAGRATGWDKLDVMEEHIHNPSLVYPTLADGVTLTSVTGGGTWTLGAFAEIVPASTITSDFDIHHLGIEDISANGVFEIHLFYGASDTFAGSVRVTRNAVQSGTKNIPMITPIIPANSRVRAKIASFDDGGQTVDTSIFYHTY